MKSFIAAVAFVSLAATAGALVAGEANVPADESARMLYDPRTKSPMDELASPEEVARFTGGLDADWALFVEDRSHSIRKSTGLPKRWLSDLPGHTRAFNGTAQPGEFYVFQIGVFAAKSATGALAAQFGDLAGPGGTIAAANLRCFNLGGVDFLGRPFSKVLRVEHGKLQALWIGVDVPKSAAGAYAGKVTMKDTASGAAQTVNLKLNVAGETLDDHGDRDSWRLSRLRWLDSKIGLDDDIVTRPFLPITRQADTLKILGRELVLGEAGLPKQIRSFFNSGSTAIADRPTREQLAAPFRFVVETGDGPVKFEAVESAFTRELKGAVSWRTVSRAQGIELAVEGLLEYDGFVDCRCRIKSAAPIKVKDIRLEADVAAGGATEDEVREALQKLDPLWDELFPAEKERIVKLLVQEVVVSRDSLLIRLRLYGLNSLVAELAGDGSAKGAGGRVVPGPDGQLVLRSEAALRGVATVDIRVPMEFKTRSGRKEIILPPDATTTADVGPRSPLVVALARAYRWQRMLDDGEVPGVEAIAAQHNVDRAYVSRILGLAMLAPNLTEAALKGNEPGCLSLRKLARSLPVRWDQQGAVLLGRVGPSAGLL